MDEQNTKKIKKLDKIVLKTTLKEAFLDSLPVMAGYIVLGTGFGILSVKSGYGIFLVLLMSILIFAGSMQYLTISLLDGGVSLVSAAVATLMVNARHLFYGISMVDKYKGAGKKKPYMIFALTDETYSLVCNKEEKENLDFHTYSFLVSLFDQCYWVIGSALGALIAYVIEFDSKGIEFAMTALFVTVFTDQWMKTKNHLAAITGVISTVICRVLFGNENFLIPSMILITFLLIVGKKRMDEKKEEDDV